MNLLTYQILNLQGESNKTGIQAGPTIHTFLFYFSLHFHENALLLSSLIAHRWVGLQTLWRFRLKDLSIDEMVRAWCFGCCQAHQGLPVGFLLLRYSVLCTVESLSLLHLLFIYWFICSRRWCMDKLGVFHANQIYVSWSTSKLRVRLALWNSFKPSSKILWLSCFCICSLLPCGHWPLGSCLWYLLWFCYFPMWYPGSGVVLDCIDSWSLPSFLLLLS